MSGGFFRGTSADQDTRFSNKQAKLLKTQKFPSELDHPVDMTKVKLDVVRPWIANRVTELLGFEDEVLINFVYGLLDGKDVDGKQVQIQLTGFMEKNTGKFMKELWSLLLSAQSNASGVPQQFLDAKEEETRKKKAENDRIADEIQRRRERDGRDLSRDNSRMGADANTARSNEAATDLVSKHPSPRTSDEKIEEERKRSPKFNRRSPPSAERSRRKSKSRSYSRERPKSKSRSVSSESTQHSPPRRRRQHSPVIRFSSPVRSVSPRRKRSSPNIPSPPRRRSPFGRRRSTSLPRRRSPSPSRRSPPVRQRSPSHSLVRRRSPSPVCRRSRSPVRRRMRSPLRRRSPSPPRHRYPSPSRRRRSRSPLRQRSPSTRLRRSPFQIRRSRSPLRPRPPVGHTSVSPTRHSSSTPPRRSPEGRSLTLSKRSASPSPKRRPADSRISMRQRNRSRTPGSRSPLYRARRSLSRDIEDHIRTNGFQTRKHRDELLSERGRRFYPDKEAVRRDAITSRDSRYKVSDSLGSPRALPGDNNSVPSSHRRERDSALKRQSPSSSASPIEQRRKLVSRHDSPEASKEENQDSHEREGAQHSTRNAQNRSKYSPLVEPKKRPDLREKGPSASATNKPSGSLYPVGRSRVFDQQNEPRSELELLENIQRQSPSDDEYYARGRVKGKMGSIDNGRARRQSKNQESEASALGGNEEQSMQESSHRDSFYAKDGKRFKLEEEKEDKDSLLKRQSGGKFSRNGIQKGELDDIGSDSENADGHNKKDKRKRKKSSRQKKYSDSDSSDDDAEDDSRGDDKKEARRRKKEERKKRKEEKRRRKEERHRRRLEGRGDKLKGRSIDTVTPPSDLEKNYKNNDEDAHDFAKRGKRGSSHPSDMEMESEQKMLEIKLRKKALDSLRAKKAINP